jgi:hypothetical protein
LLSDLGLPTCLAQFHVEAVKKSSNKPGRRELRVTQKVKVVLNCGPYKYC